MRALTTSDFEDAVSALARRDPRLGRLVEARGRPPFWTHPSGFPGLTLAVLAQQVSLESAQAAFRKLEEALGTVTPRGFLSLDAERLRRIGFSRQKAGYVGGIADGIVASVLDLDAIVALPDAEARERLTAIRGVGPWTADTYLLFSLRRPDAWPTGDLALESAVSEIAGAGARLASADVDLIAREWSPLRAVAARILWHHYLTERGRSFPD